MSLKRRRPKSNTHPMYIRLEKLIEKSGKSRRSIMQSIGISPSMISNIWMTEKLPNFEVMIKIADHFGVSLDYIAFGEDAPSAVKDLSTNQRILWDMLSTLQGDYLSYMLGYMKSGIEKAHGLFKNSDSKNKSCNAG